MLLHSIVPHIHHDATQAAQHEIEQKSAHEILDILELMFHVDMGEDHLENFQSANGFDLDLKAGLQLHSLFNFCLISDIYDITISDDFTTRDFPDDVPIPLSILSAPLDLRGPPSHS